MKKLIVVGTGAIGALAVSALVGGGVAAAGGDYAGETYADASSAISDSGGSAVIVSRVGSTLSTDDCIVVNSQSAPFIRDGGGEFGHADSEVSLALNCAGAYASATNPGASVADPMGRAAKAADDEEAAAQAAAAAAQNEQDQLDFAGETPGGTVNLPG